MPTVIEEQGNLKELPIATGLSSYDFDAVSWAAVDCWQQLTRLFSYSRQHEELLTYNMIHRQIAMLLGKQRVKVKGHLPDPQMVNKLSTKSCWAPGASKGSQRN